MKRHNFFVWIVFLLSACNLHAQKATICFNVAKACQALVYEPIDGAYNSRVVTGELLLSPNQKTFHEVEIKTFGFVYLQFPQYQRTCNVILFPHDTIQISINERELKLYGANQTGQQFYYDNFTSIPFEGNYRKMYNLFQEYVTQKRDIHSVIPAINREVITPYMREIETFPSELKTTRAFADVLKTQVSLAFTPDLVSLLRMLLIANRDKSFVMKDSLIIKNRIDSICHLYPFNKDLFRYDSRLFVIRYLQNYFKGKAYSGKYDELIFGPYKLYLHAPGDMQPDLFGNACMVQLKYDSKEMDLKAFRQFFNNEFPDSPYTAIINKRLKDLFAFTEDGQLDEHLFIEDSIDSLCSLTKVASLQGQYLFIDLWASWCMPCRGEFNYQKQLHQILSKYKNVTPVYISIDKAQQVEAWKSCITRYRLGGFHLRASVDLVKNIQEEIYGTERFDIPRYVLVSPSGEILHKDLPRPSHYPQLEEALDHILK